MTNAQVLYKDVLDTTVSDSIELILVEICDAELSLFQLSDANSSSVNLFFNNINLEYIRGNGTMLQ